MNPIFSSSPLLLVLGFLVGMLGTLVGAGGGFILVPLLVFLLPNESADRVTAISMAVVLFNASSGTWAYARMRRIDWASGGRFALAALPGALAGAFATAYFSRQAFDRALGVALVIVALFLVQRSFRRVEVIGHEATGEPFRLDARGQRVGSALSAVVGFVSSALGIGGGIIHVPALVYVLRYPVHIATATSHFVLACTSLVAVVEHLARGSYSGNGEHTVALAIGAILGAQVGARLSARVNGPTIVRCLAAALMFAGYRIVWRTLG